MGSKRARLGVHWMHTCRTLRLLLLLSILSHQLFGEMPQDTAQVSQVCCKHAVTVMHIDEGINQGR